jgi:hypothetical protein
MTAERDARSPAHSQRAGAGVGLRAARELAVEFARRVAFGLFGANLSAVIPGPAIQVGLADLDAGARNP